MKTAQLRLLIAIARFLIGDPGDVLFRRADLAKEIERAERAANGL